MRAVRRTPRRAARAGAQLGRDRAPPTRASFLRPRRCRSRASPATSSRRCSGRPASTPATPSAPTAPARSSSPTPAPTLERSDAGLLSTAAWRSPDGELTYALEGAIFVTGAAVQWLRDGLQIVGSAAETAAIAATVDDVRGRRVRAGADRPRRPRTGTRTPAARSSASPAARRAPTWSARRWRRSPSRCATCSTTMPAPDSLTAARRRRRQPPTTCSASSRPTSSAYPSSGRGSSRPPRLGAAFLAGLGIGVWDSTDDLRETWQLDRRFEPGRPTAPPPTRRTPAGRTPSSAPMAWARLSRSPSSLSRARRAPRWAASRASDRPRRGRPAPRPGVSSASVELLVGLLGRRLELGEPAPELVDLRLELQAARLELLDRLAGGRPASCSASPAGLLGLGQRLPRPPRGARASPSSPGTTCSSGGAGGSGRGRRRPRSPSASGSATAAATSTVVDPGRGQGRGQQPAADRLRALAGRPSRRSGSPRPGRRPPG